MSIKHLTAEHKEKIRQTALRRGVSRGENNSMFGKRGVLSPHFKGFKYCSDCGKQLARRVAKKCHACASADKFKGYKYCLDCKKQLAGKFSTKSLRCKRCSLLGEHTLIHKQLRCVIEYRTWRSDIFTRDNFTCQSCGKRGGNMNAHHIKFFSTILNEYKIKSLKEGLACDELWNLNNGVTLCEICHNDAHNLKR